MFDGQAIFYTDQQLVAADHANQRDGGDITLDQAETNFTHFILETQEH